MTKIDKKEKLFEEMYDGYKPLVVFIASTYLDDKSRIDDIVQEVFLELFTHIKDVKDIKAYLTTVTKNKAIALNKEKNKDIQVESMDVFSTESINKNKDYSVVIDELNSILSSVEINIIFAHLFGNYTFKEIAENLNMNEMTVKTTYYRALRKCRKEKFLK